MSNSNYIVVIEDCEALLIPTAIPITIPAGTKLELRQNLGNSFTVFVGGNLARVDASNAKALGITIEEDSKGLEVLSSKDLKYTIWEQLKKCFDPEIPVNIVDLGLIYKFELIKKEHNNYMVDIDMTLTAAGCGMGPVLAKDVEQLVLAIPNVHKVNVNLVFDPPWTQDLMTEEAKLELGLL